MAKFSEVARECYDGHYKYALSYRIIDELGKEHYNYLLCDDVMYGLKLAALHNKEIIAAWTPVNGSWKSEDFEEFKKRHKRNEARTRKDGEGSV